MVLPHSPKLYVDSLAHRACKLCTFDHIKFRTPKEIESLSLRSQARSVRGVCVDCSRLQHQNRDNRGDQYYRSLKTDQYDEDVLYETIERPGLTVSALIVASVRHCRHLLRL